MSHVLLSLATAVPVSAPKWQQDLWLLPLNCLLLHPPSPWLLKDVTTPAPFWINMNSSACVTTTSLASPSTHHLNCHHQLFSPNKSSSDYHLAEHTLKALLKYYIQADPAPLLCFISLPTPCHTLCTCVSFASKVSFPPHLPPVAINSSLRAQLKYPILSQNFFCILKHIYCHIQ